MNQRVQVQSTVFVKLLKINDNTYVYGISSRYLYSSSKMNEKRHKWFSNKSIISAKSALYMSTANTAIDCPNGLSSRYFFKQCNKQSYGVILRTFGHTSPKHGFGGASKILSLYSAWFLKTLANKFLGESPLFANLSRLS